MNFKTQKHIVNFEEQGGAFVFRFISQLLNEDSEIRQLSEIIDEVVSYHDVYDEVPNPIGVETIKDLVAKFETLPATLAIIVKRQGNFLKFDIQNGEFLP